MKKRYLSLIIIFILFLQNISFLYAEDSTIYRILYDDNTYLYKKFPELIIDDKLVETGEMPAIITAKNRTLVPVREVFESMGATVEWDNENKQAFIITDNQVIIFTVDSNIALVDNKEIELDETAKIVVNLDKNPNAGKVMVPLRFVLELFDFQIIFDKANYKIYAYSKEKVDVQTNGQDSSENENNESQSGATEEPVIDLGQGNLIWKAKDDEAVTNATVTKEKLDYQKHATANVIDVDYIDSSKTFIIKTDKPITQGVDNLWKNKLIIDVKNAMNKLNGEEKQLDDNEFVEKIRYSQFEEDVTRVVFDLKNEGMEYTLSYGQDRQTIMIKFGSNYIYELQLGNDTKGQYVEIEGVNVPTTNVFRLSNPNRIVIDVLGVTSSFKYTEQAVEYGYVKNLRFSQFDDKTFRVVIDINGEADYEVITSGNKAFIYFKKPNYSNVYYENDSNPRIALKKDRAGRITENNILIQNDYLNRTGYITVTGDNLEQYFGTGQLEVNDQTVKDIKLVPTKDKFKFIIETSVIREFKITEDEKYLYIEILSPKDVYDKIVVIDPGHGSYDSGKPTGNGNYAELNERELNTLISMELFNMLERDQSIKVYMTRFETDTPDTFNSADMVKPILQYRTVMANEIEADLFVSVHNNAFFSSYTGTETLFFNDGGQDGLLSKKIASIMQRNVVKEVGLQDRGIKVRNDLYVLRTSAMPAVLVEVGYMTNKYDGAKLRTPEFRYDSALGIYNGILEIFKVLP